MTDSEKLDRIKLILIPEAVERGAYDPLIDVHEVANELVLGRKFDAECLFRLSKVCIMLRLARGVLEGKCDA